MTQREIDRQVARATGESVAEIRHLGFGEADPLEVDYDPEPSCPLPQLLDWDQVQRDRNVAIVEQLNFAV